MMRRTQAVPINLSSSRQARRELLDWSATLSPTYSGSPVRCYRLSLAYLKRRPLCYVLPSPDLRTVLSEPLADDAGEEAELPHLAW